MPRMFRATLFAATFLLTLCAFASNRETVIRNFSPLDGEGTNPTGGLLMDKAGNLYGAALSGTIFEFSPDDSGGWNTRYFTIAPILIALTPWAFWRWIMPAIFTAQPILATFLNIRETDWEVGPGR